jgi:hypothetical protein
VLYNFPNQGFNEAADTVIWGAEVAIGSGWTNVANTGVHFA